MKKTESSKRKDLQKYRGRFWMHDPDMDIRQASGVTFGGRYVSITEYKEWIKRKEGGDQDGT